MYEFSYKPRAPYWFSLHLETFSIPGEPLPWVYDPGGPGCRRLVKLPGSKLAAVEVVFEGEPWRPSIKVRVWTRSPLEAERAYEAVLSVSGPGLSIAK